MEFVPFQKIYRLARKTIITEKIDGTNALIYIGEDGTFLTGSRTKWITPEDDNYGFAKWAQLNKTELLQLGLGYHYGEWWGKGIQRNYNLSERRFSLFNSTRWTYENTPKCCHVVPIIRQMIGFDEKEIKLAMDFLKTCGSLAAKDYMNPEGIVIFHEPSKTFLKK